MCRIRAVWFVLLVSGATACSDDATGPLGTELYALRRVGSRPLPTYLDASNQSQLILADSLAVPLRSIRDGATFVVRRVQVGRSLPEPAYRFEGEHRADVEKTALVIDTCPIGALCIATLVYAPFTLTIVGDSLVEVPPAGATWEPRVYGLVGRSGRIR